MSPLKRRPENWNDYQLIDCGSGKKLERFGDFITIRPEPNANWPAKLSKAEWEKRAHVVFEQSSSTSGKWKKLKPIPKQWPISYSINKVPFKFLLKLTQFKHVGIFPEQAVNWQMIHSALKPGERFLNLFAYTGGASLVAKETGAEVLHVDSIKQVITWAKENMELSLLSDIKWVLEDALKFSSREKKRGNKYDMIILDPPAFGRGPKGEKWKLDEHIYDMIENCAHILAPKGKLVLNNYASGWSEKDVKDLLLKHFPNERLEIGQLFLKDSFKKELPMGIYGWVNYS